MRSSLLFTHFMVRVLLHPTLMPFIFVTYNYLFLPFIAPNMLLIYLFRRILCVIHSARVSQVVCAPPFLLFSVLYFADKASKLITFLSTSFFFVYLSS